MEKRVFFKGWLLPLLLIAPQILVSAVFFFYPAGQAVWQSLFIPDPFGLSMQYCMDLTPDLRANIDYIFILRENIIQNREKIYKNFFGIFPTFDMFNQVMDACTENYECVVLDNTSKSNKVEDVVFWYKAKMHKSFKAGHPKFWNLHNKLYDPKHDEKELEEVYKKTSNKPTITIKKTK